MATASEKTELANLKTDVALIKQDLVYIKGTQGEIKNELQKLNYPTKDEFVEFKNQTHERITKLEEDNQRNSLGAAVSNMLANDSLKYIVGAIILAAVYAIARSGGFIK